MTRAFRPFNLLIIALICLTFEVLSHRLHGSNIAFSLEFIAFTIGAMMVTAAGYLINGYFDQKIDRINKPGYHFPFNKTKTYGISLVLVAFGLTIGVIFYSIEFTLGFILMPAIVLWLYSASLKRLPLIGNISVAFLSFWLPTGLLLTNESLDLLKSDTFSSQITMLLLVEMFVISLAREIIKDIQDIEGDRIENCNTFPILINEKIAGITASALLTIGALMWFNVLKKNLESLSILNIAFGALTLLFVLGSIVLLWNKKAWKERTKLSSMTIKLSMLFALLTAIFI